MDQVERAAREREAKARRFVRGLQQDLILFGIPERTVKTMSVRELIDRRERIVQRLQTAPPGDQRCRD